LLPSQKNNVKSSATVWLVDGRTVDEHDLFRYFFWLNAEEVERYHGFVRRQRQRQFLIGRILLRRALANLLGIAAEHISLSEQKNNAPRLNCPEPIPGVSLSHSGPWVACAVSVNTVLGLDIEVIDARRDLVALSEQAFDADELAMLSNYNDDTKLNAFYSVWSTKEAQFKLASNVHAFDDAKLAENTQMNCINLSRTDLSIVVCSANPLIAVPQIIHFDLSE
jgi:4'-phosphopantetheinyl transferase